MKGIIGILGPKLIAIIIAVVIVGASAGFFLTQSQSPQTKISPLTGNEPTQIPAKPKDIISFIDTTSDPDLRRQATTRLLDQTPADQLPDTIATLIINPDPSVYDTAINYAIKKTPENISNILDILIGRILNQSINPIPPGLPTLIQNWPSTPGLPNATPIAPVQLDMCDIQSDYDCPDWSECVDGTQTKTCTKKTTAECEGEQTVIESQNCTIDCSPNWSCSDWAPTCPTFSEWDARYNPDKLYIQEQTKSCYDLNSCELDGGHPIELRQCPLKIKRLPGPIGCPGSDSLIYQMIIDPNTPSSTKQQLVASLGPCFRDSSGNIQQSPPGSSFRLNAEKPYIQIVSPPNGFETEATSINLQVNVNNFLLRSPGGLMGFKSFGEKSYIEGHVVAYLDGREVYRSQVNGGDQASHSLNIPIAGLEPWPGNKLREYIITAQLYENNRFTVVPEVKNSITIKVGKEEEEKQEPLRLDAPSGPVAYCTLPTVAQSGVNPNTDPAGYYGKDERTSNADSTYTLALKRGGKAAINAQLGTKTSAGNEAFTLSEQTAFSSEPVQFLAKASSTLGGDFVSTGTGAAIADVLNPTYTDPKTGITAELIQGPTLVLKRQSFDVIPFPWDPNNTRASMPAIVQTQNPFIAVLSSDKKIYAINPDGSKKWEYSTDIKIGKDRYYAGETVDLAGDSSKELVFWGPTGEQSSSLYVLDDSGSLLCKRDFGPGAAEELKSLSLSLDKEQISASPGDPVKIVATVKNNGAKKTFGTIWYGILDKNDKSIPRVDLFGSSAHSSPDLSDTEYFFDLQPGESRDLDLELEAPTKIYERDEYTIFIQLEDSGNNQLTNKRVSLKNLKYESSYPNTDTRIHSVGLGFGMILADGINAKKADLLRTIIENVGNSQTSGEWKITAKLTDADGMIVPLKDENGAVADYIEEAFFVNRAGGDFLIYEPTLTFLKETDRDDPTYTSHYLTLTLTIADQNDQDSQNNEVSFRIQCYCRQYSLGSDYQPVSYSSKVKETMVEPRQLTRTLTSNRNSESQPFDIGGMAVIPEEKSMVFHASDGNIFSVKLKQEGNSYSCSTEWSTYTGSEAISDYLVSHDMNGDGISDIIAPTGLTYHQYDNYYSHDGVLRVLNGKDGSVILNKDLGVRNIAPAIADLNRDGLLDIFIISISGAGGSPYIGRYDNNFNQVWKQDIDYNLRDSNVIFTDMNGDGKKEGALVSSNGVVASIDMDTGETRWSLSVSGEEDKVTLPAVVDIDGDGREEIIVVGEAFVSVVSENDGKPKVSATYPLTNPSLPIVIDINGDGVLDVIVTAGNDNTKSLGNLVILKPTKNKSTDSWTTIACNSQRDGCEF